MLTANLNMYPMRRFYLFISPFQNVIVNLNVTIAVCLEHFSKSLYRENWHSHLKVMLHETIRNDDF